MKRVLIDVYGSTADGGPDDSRLDVLLENWAEWMRAGSYGQGYPKRTPGLRSTGGTDLDAMTHDVDVRLARAVDAIVDGLPQNEQLAVLRAYRLTADVWRLREPWDALLARARVAVRVGLKQRRVE
jgi:hypothetical protein